MIIGDMLGKMIVGCELSTGGQRSSPRFVLNVGTHWSPALLTRREIFWFVCVNCRLHVEESPVMDPFFVL